MDVFKLAARIGSGLAIAASLFLLPPRAEAAESIVFKYGVLQQSISVAELKTFAQTGELSLPLRGYLLLAGKDPADVRKMLSQEIAINPLLAAQILNSPLAEAILTPLSQAIAPAEGANLEALRSALVNSAVSSGKITLIQALENYPSQEVFLDGDRIVEVYKQISSLSGKLPKF